MQKNFMKGLILHFKSVFSSTYFQTRIKISQKTTFEHAMFPKLQNFSGKKLNSVSIYLIFSGSFCLQKNWETLK